MFRVGDKTPLTCRGGGWVGGWVGGWGVATVISGVAVSSHRAEVDEAGLVGGDGTVDPSLIFRHSGVYSREIGQGTSSTKAHHSRQDPLQTLFAHQRTTRVTLQGKRIKATMG